MTAITKFETTTTAMYYSLHLSDGTTFDDWKITNLKELGDAIKTTCEDENFADRYPLAAFEIETGGGSTPTVTNYLPHFLRLFAVAWLDKNLEGVWEDTSDFSEMMSVIESKTDQSFNACFANEIQAIALSEYRHEAA